MLTKTSENIKLIHLRDKRFVTVNILKLIILKTPIEIFRTKYTPSQVSLLKH